jgi:hypothetical protein
VRATLRPVERGKRHLDSPTIGKDQVTLLGQILDVFGKIPGSVDGVVETPQRLGL